MLKEKLTRKYKFLRVAAVSNKSSYTNTTYILKNS